MQEAVITKEQAEGVELQSGAATTTAAVVEMVVQVIRLIYQEQIWSMVQVVVVVQDNAQMELVEVAQDLVAAVTAANTAQQTEEVAVVVVTQLAMLNVVEMVVLGLLLLLMTSQILCPSQGLEALLRLQETDRYTVLHHLKRLRWTPLDIATS